MAGKSSGYMVKAIEAEAKAAAPWVKRAAIDPRILAVMAKIPRHEFVSSELNFAAYDNGPLPIGYGQTISQPYIVALMTDALQLTPECTVLEIGAGSGYQAAVLSQLVSKVYSVEIIPALAAAAAKRLHRLGYTNVDVRQGNGRLGLPEHAPFDAIIVTAAAEAIPPALIEQLRPGGRLVIPVGNRYYGQDLQLLVKAGNGKVSIENILPVAFVPLTGQT
jgi:protein-L-isoaspartate(D-aspartate) O-methyltransferase